MVSDRRCRTPLAQRPQRGAAVVEFCLVAGFLLLLSFALLDLGLLLHSRLVLAQAARAGLRQAIIDGGASEKAYAVMREQLASGGLTENRTDIAIAPRSAHYGTTVRVTLDHDYRLRTPLAAAIGQEIIHLGVTLLGRSENLGEEAP